MTQTEVIYINKVYFKAFTIIVVIGLAFSFSFCVVLLLLLLLLLLPYKLCMITDMSSSVNSCYIE